MSGVCFSSCKVSLTSAERVNETPGVDIERLQSALGGEIKFIN